MKEQVNRAYEGRSSHDEKTESFSEVRIFTNTSIRPNLQNTWLKWFLLHCMGRVLTDGLLPKTEISSVNILSK